MAPYKILKQGYIEKEPPISKRGLRKKLVRYWFVLVEDKKQVALVYFKNEDQYIARQRNEGFIRVDEAQSISVVGEYMGRKHAFVIKTPKGEYVLAPESRYDLHEWLFTLHNALEVFKRKQERLRQRQATRPRANTVGSTGAKPQGAQRTPPHTPTRRAPPPPTAQGSAPRKRPNRPAPRPPPSHPHNGSLPQQGHSFEDETPPPGYTESDVVSQDVPSTHEVMDLDISQVDNDIHELLPVDTNLHEDPPKNGETQVLDEEHMYRSSQHSSTVERCNLNHQTSSSLPDLLTHGEDTPTTTPDDERVSELGQEGDSPPENRKGSTPSQFHIRHTRHHSLTIAEIRSKKKRSSRRQGSIKLRSRSPPELPPPPPPEGEVPASPAPLEERSTESTDLEMVHEASAASLGFSGVIDTLSDIEQQIDQMSDEFSPKPGPAVRGATGGESPVAFPFSMVRTPSPVPEQPEGDDFNEEEWLCDDPPGEPHPLPVEYHAPLVDEVRQGVLASPENAEVETIPAPDQHRRSKQVMFKDEVEDIPNTYEPMADSDNESDSDDESDSEAIPSSVAELKKRLFGNNEVEAARYKREGPLSPKYTHPLNASFDEAYKFTGQSSREWSPNANNNNSGGETELVGDVRESNLYDKPWDLKMAAARKQKEPTPPPVAPKPVTSPTHTKESGWSDPAHSMGDNESLLSSISSTLQETSKYGSDSLLSNYDPTPKKKSEVRFSSKGELERIRAEHRREPPPPPQGPAPSLPPLLGIVPTPQDSPQANHTSQGVSPKHQGTSPQRPSPRHTGSPQAAKKLSPSHQKASGQTNKNFVGPPRNAASLDTLRDAKPNTQVTYDASTNSHIFRSLV